MSNTKALRLRFVGAIEGYYRMYYVGVDNDSGEAWTEAFRTRRQCLRWLRGLEAEDCGALGYGKN